MGERRLGINFSLTFSLSYTFSSQEAAVNLLIFLYLQKLNDLISSLIEIMVFSHGAVKLNSCRKPISKMLVRSPELKLT